MKLIDRYIAKSVLAAIGLVTLMLAGLQVFILFVGQLDEIGRANYGILQATQFVFLQMPYQVYLFFPMASLLGCLIGLGVLANHRELIVMRAAGVSIGHVTLAVLKAAMLLIIVVTLFGETIVPKLARLANDQKIQALSAGQTLRTMHGVWLRYQNDFITIGTVTSDNTLLDVYQFHFDADHHLRLARFIKHIDYQNGVWQAYGVSETAFYDGQTKVRKMDSMVWEIALKPATISVGNRETDEMTLRELRQSIRAKKMSRQVAHHDQLAYLQRLIQPLTTVVMMVLAIPFIFGPLRSSTMGSKLLVGAAVGFGFRIINSFFGPLSQVLQWPPEVAAFGPTFVFAVIGIYLMSRVR